MNNKKTRDVIPVEQVRRVYPELTRCVHCGVLDEQTVRYSIGLDENGEPVLRLEDPYVCLWLHKACIPAFREQTPIDPKRLEWEWGDRPKPYRRTLYFPELIFEGKRSATGNVARHASEVMRTRPREFNEKGISNGPPFTTIRGADTNRRCYCCEHGELPEHRAHRCKVGFHPQASWPGRLEPGELL
jgi:hypothetical protein